MALPDGPHLSFPFRIGPHGRAAQIASLEEHIRDELIQLILTNLGERAFLPEFGAGLRRLIFEGSSDINAAIAKAAIAQAISRWLGERIVLEDLTVEAQNETITVDLQYRIAGTQDQRRMRFERKGG